MKKITHITIFIAIVGLVTYVIYDFIDSKAKEKSSINKSAIEIIDDDGELLTDDDGKKIKYGVNKGDMVYDYELTDIRTGETVKISDFKGERLLLNFWASWCPPCRAEAPELKSFSESSDVIVLGLNAKSAERTEGAEIDFIEEFELDFPNWYASDEMLNDFYVQSFPTSVLVNSDGIIEEGVIGGLSEEILEILFKEIK